MRKSNLTRSLMAAVSIVALSAVMYGCTGSGDDAPATEMPPPVDTDGDGVPDADDAFPNDPTETKDSDGDGVGDNAQEAKALADAKAAAMAAWEAARDALARIAGDEDENPVAYQRAMNALADAKAAYDAASAASTSADAEMYQADAEEARDTVTMQVAAVVYSRDMEAIGAARTAADQAVQTAKQSYEAAKNALAAVEDFKALDMASYDMAMAQVTAAKEAYDAAMAASNQAAEAMLLEDAEDHRDAARTAMGNADTANTNAMKYAGMVQTAENNALADARMKADEAYKAAKEAADDARQAANDASDEADAAEEANDGSPAAMNSRKYANEAAEAATDAETARDAASTAKMAADDAATSAAARMHQATAEEEQGKAEGHLETAQMKLAKAEEHKMTARNTGAGTILLWQQRAEDAKTEADGYATAAREAANKADEQADAAEDDAAEAMRARTDYANANKKAMEARNAANAAETAAMAAETAARNAKAAYEAAKADDATVKVAREQSNIARAAAMGAAGEPAKANTQYMAAMEAAEEAADYAKTHVISLLSHANGQDITDVTEDVTTAPALMKARDDRVKAVAGVIGGAAGDHSAVATDLGDRDQDSSTSGATGTVSTATALWPANTPADPDATPPTEEVPMHLSIDVTTTTTGTTLEFRTEAEEADDATTTTVDETIVTATKLDRGLGTFEHGYEIEDRGTHAIVFTDKKQATLAEPMRVVTVTNVPVVASRIIENELQGQNQATPTPAATAEPVTNAQLHAVADLTANARYDHDGNPDTLALAGTFACVPTGDCTAIQVSATGEVVGVVGDGTLVFSAAPSLDGDGNPEVDNFIGITKAAVAADPMNDYLAFGVWLREEVRGTNGAVTTALAFGAFAHGGEDFVTPATLTGKATYTGSATGVYTEGESVDYFEGRAELTANFGAIDTDDERVTDPPADTTAGTVTGMIKEIVAGGDRMTDVINLRSADISATGGFNGNTRMGEPTIEDNDTVTYTYNGTWSGQFYGPAAAADATGADTLPPAAAGTFGVTGVDDMGTTTGDNATDDDVTRTYVGAFGARVPSDD